MAVSNQLKNIYKILKSYVNELDTRWRKRANKITTYKSSIFFLNVILNQQQKTGRAGCAACNLVYYNPTLKMNGGDERTHYKAFWKKISEMSPKDIRSACIFSYDSDCEGCENFNKWKGFYAGKNSGLKRFPSWLKFNANMIIEDYEGSVENIWNYKITNDVEIIKKNIDECRERFSEFQGIGPQLANYAVFCLVRDYGLLGGVKARSYLRIKEDVHVRRVISKSIFANEDYKNNLDNISNVISTLNSYESPADIDLALWNIGINYCQYDECGECPLSENCAYIE